MILYYFINAPPNNSMDVRAKQRLYYCGSSSTQSCVLAVSRHVNIVRLLRLRRIRR